MSPWRFLREGNQKVARSGPFTCLISSWRRGKQPISSLCNEVTIEVSPWKDYLFTLLLVAPHRTAPPPPPCRQRHCSFEFYNLISVCAVYLGLVASQGWVERGIKTWQPGSGCLRAPASRPRLETCFLFLFPAASCAAAHYHPLQSPLPASPQNISPSPRPVSGTLVVADI